MLRRKYRRYSVICFFAAIIITYLLVKWYSETDSNATCLYASSVYRAMQLDNVRPILLSVNTVNKAECEERESSPIEVPNVIHYIWFGDAWNVTFLNYLSFLSVHKMLSPDLIFVHGENIPIGYWWNRTKRDVANIYYVYREAPLTALNGQLFKFEEHRSDLARLQVVLSYGGIFIDKDTIVLRSFDELRKHEVVLSRESKELLSNSVIVGQRGAPFLKILTLAYHGYRGMDEEWTGTSLKVPSAVASALPTMLHIEEDTFNRPLHNQLYEYFCQYYDWRRLYATHVWARLAEQAGYTMPRSPEDIRAWNGSFGDITRFIYYG